ncbi:LysR family transcriptional regulator [Achromobacter sp. GG226]|uniref:LysR family transcriptional regulator n=1 Tax=Verticiella alkaliphila TaxID=2779529 RepID=UPI001C0B0F96|nr:LysR family transcriptional regulator [Verticiella sp. GG226]MBU4609557.1 LysR family transcriptional regulator [Verticiella sp. GG226]
MVTIKQLRALIGVAETGSFTAAARRLAVTQSAISVMIRELEELVGEPLVVRGRNVHLTAAGETLRASALRSITDLNRTLDGIRTGREQEGGRLRLAAGPLAAATFMPRALALFRERQPMVSVDLVDMPVQDVAQGVAVEQVDIAVGALGNNPRLAGLLRSEPLLNDRVYAVYGAGLAPELRGKSKRLPRAVLQDAEIILTGRVTGQWRDFFLQFSEEGITFNIAYEVSLYSTVLQMVRCGLGMTLLPAFAASHLDPTVYDVRAIDHGSARWPVQWITRQGGAPSTAALALRKAVDDTLAEQRNSHPLP